MDHRSSKLAPVMNAIKQSVDLVNEGKHDEAVKACDWAIAAARKLGITSGALFWHAAVANDYAGNWEAAFDRINQALDRDPLNEPFRNSFGVITNRIRAALARADRAVDDPSTPKLYELLVRAGEADVGCHAVMARYAAATGDLAKARAIADAAALLFPASPEAWKARSEVAAKAGDAATVEACAVELAALGEPVVPFAVPGLARS
jgi:tetratricopeptide (TPR) repeat protein